MQTHVVELTKQRLSDFFVKEEGYVAHKNALVAGTVATGAIFALLLLAPDTAEAHHKFQGGDVMCDNDEFCCNSSGVFFVLTTQDAGDFRLGLTQKRHMIL